MIISDAVVQGLITLVGMCGVAVLTQRGKTRELRMAHDLKAREERRSREEDLYAEIERCVDGLQLTVRAQCRKIGDLPIVDQEQLDAAEQVRQRLSREPFVYSIRWAYGRVWERFLVVLDEADKARGAKLEEHPRLVRSADEFAAAVDTLSRITRDKRAALWDRSLAYTSVDLVYLIPLFMVRSSQLRAAEHRSRSLLARISITAPSANDTQEIL